MAPNQITTVFGIYRFIKRIWQSINRIEWGTKTNNKYSKNGRISKNITITTELQAYGSPSVFLNIYLHSLCKENLCNGILTQINLRAVGEIEFMRATHHFIYLWIHIFLVTSRNKLLFFVLSRVLSDLCRLSFCSYDSFLKFHVILNQAGKFIIQMLHSRDMDYLSTYLGCF